MSLRGTQPAFDPVEFGDAVTVAMNLELTWLFEAVRHTELGDADGAWEYLRRFAFDPDAEDDRQVEELIESAGDKLVTAGQDQRWHAGDDVGVITTNSACELFIRVWHVCTRALADDFGPDDVAGFLERHGITRGFFDALRAGMNRELVAVAGEAPRKGQPAAGATRQGRRPKGEKPADTQTLEALCVWHGYKDGGVTNPTPARGIDLANLTKPKPHEKGRKGLQRNALSRFLSTRGGDRAYRAACANDTIGLRLQGWRGELGDRLAELRPEGDADE